jgi:uncharacterized protein YfaQ (DUF2300 family)
VHASRFAESLLVGSVLAAMLSCCTQVQAAGTASAAWLRDGRVEMRTLASDGVLNDAQNGGTIRVPLGSLWKLFAFSYLAETRAEESAYTCSQKSPVPDEDRYCCVSGESIGRDQALARSCAPYFSPARIGITSAKWQAHWRMHAAPAWLLDIKRMQPETEVPVAELLAVLASITPEARAQARAAMLEAGIRGYGRDVWTILGTGIRYKTYSWHLADGSAFGGAAGWLADGTPFWFGARGSSRTALATWATRLASALPAPRWRDTVNVAGDASCVDVDFFARYPLRAVWKADEKVQVTAGDLKGRYRLEFRNGNWLSITARGDLSLTQDADGTPSISGRFPLNEYVARVIDREGDARHAQAARALAIAARSYLVQNARFEAGCWRIADSSRTQRVSANPPSFAALAAAWFTDDIILNGTPVQYHQDKPAANRLAWRDAVTRNGQGWDFERILSVAYPKAGIATMSGREDCKRLSDAESWLAGASGSWKARLRREPGFEPLDVPARICALAEGHPYSDQQRLRIYVRGWRSLDERITLAHEYLHLVFRFHPNGANEDYIERLARRLIEG